MIFFDTWYLAFLVVATLACYFALKWNLHGQTHPNWLKSAHRCLPWAVLGGVVGSVTLPVLTPWELGWLDWTLFLVRYAIGAVIVNYGAFCLAGEAWK